MFVALYDDVTAPCDSTVSVYIADKDKSGDLTPAIHAQFPKPVFQFKAMGNL